ncbi:hypothetical protein B5E58_12575 [Tyzzerella sp. An114]|uniref:DUF2971 domain-containing protein n=1 Tax=Tyzzerella sp. An114 TaxID=1965545 RepID=UPI000B43B257|nr:DUF2971 domain-containing protein [Tyzzerella sp. An114]OUQ55257.1 hypothetical protein B5E58_12575 [Tyzzerella sp. An114]
MCLLDEFYNNLGASSQHEFHEKFMPEQYKEKIYHYTSPSGLASILFGNSEALTLRASRYDTQNDTSEGEVVMEVYRKVLKKFSNIENIPKNLDNIKPTRTLLMYPEINGKIKITRPECEKYICCFSKNPDSLPMWNYYSKGNAYEGYNIGLDVNEFNNCLGKIYKNIEVSSKVYPIIYDEDEQEKLVESFIKKVLSQYSPKHDFSVRYTISNQLAMWQLLFKSKYFKHEEEVRVIINVAKKTSSKKSPLDIKYRANGMYIIPYIEMNLDKECLSSLMFGPQQWNDEQKNHQIKIMKNMLVENGYSKNNVVCSKMPLRY